MKRFLLLVLCLAFLASGCTLAMTKTSPDGKISGSTYSLALDLSGVASQLPAIVNAINRPVVPTPVTPTPTPVTPTPTPVTPTPDPVTPTPTPVTGNIVVLDFALLPDAMRAQGWQGSDTQLDYALFSTFGNHTWSDPYVDATSTALYNARDAIKAWFDGYVQSIASQMKANPGMTATCIANDANDFGGMYLGQPIWDRLVSLGIDPSRLRMGDIFYPATFKNLKGKTNLQRKWR